MVKLELEDQDVIDLIALLINFEVLSSEWFENNEPTVSVAKRLVQDILKKSVEGGLVATDEDLKQRTRDFVVSGLDFKHNQGWK